MSVLNWYNCICYSAAAAFVSQQLLIFFTFSPAILMPSLVHLMKISDSIIKFYCVGITFPFLSMEIACVRPEIRVFSRVALEGYVHM